MAQDLAEAAGADQVLDLPAVSGALGDDDLRSLINDVAGTRGRSLSLTQAEYVLDRILEVDPLRRPLFAIVATLDALGDDEHAQTRDSLRGERGSPFAGGRWFVVMPTTTRRASPGNGNLGRQAAGPLCVRRRRIDLFDLAAAISLGIMRSRDEGAAHFGAVPARYDTEPERLLGFNVARRKTLHGCTFR